MIVLLHGAPAFGAVERYVLDLVAGLRQDDEDIVLVHPDAPVLEPFAQAAGGRVRTVSLDTSGPAPLVLARTTRLLRSLRPRVTHVTDVWSLGLLAARLARPDRVLVTHHTPELPRRDNALGRALLSLAWRTRPEVIYTSEADRATDGRAGLTTHVVPLGIDLDRFRGAAPSLRGSGPLVGTVARLAPQKDQRTILEAVPLVLAARPDARFAIVGEGELRGELEQQARRLGVADHVLFPGARDDVPEVLASFSVFVHPSRFEGLCLAVIEAQAAGVPVVATPVGGMRETVVDGETGLVVPVGDAGALAAAVVSLLESPERARALVAEARRRVSRYSGATMVEATLGLYR